MSTLIEMSTLKAIRVQKMLPSSKPFYFQNLRTLKSNEHCQIALNSRGAKFELL